MRKEQLNASLRRSKTSIHFLPHHGFKLAREATQQSVGPSPPVVVRLVNAVTEFLDAFVKVYPLGKQKQKPKPTQGSLDESHYSATPDTPDGPSYATTEPLASKTC